MGERKTFCHCQVARRDSSWEYLRASRSSQNLITFPSESSLIAHARHWNDAISNYEEIFLFVTFLSFHVLIFSSILNKFISLHEIFGFFRALLLLLFAMIRHNGNSFHKTCKDSYVCLFLHIELRPRERKARLWYLSILYKWPVVFLFFFEIKKYI